MKVNGKNGFVTELECGYNFAYILEDNKSFLTTEYKVLQSQTDSYFVDCIKMLYNGKVQLYYMTESFRPLSTLLPLLDIGGFVLIVASLLADIIDVKYNGFLSCQKIDTSLEHIYVDINTYHVKLVYLPTNRKLYSDSINFENGIRAGIIKIISCMPNLVSPETMQLASDLSDVTLTLEDVYSRLQRIMSGDIYYEGEYDNSIEFEDDSNMNYEENNVEANNDNKEAANRENNKEQCVLQLVAMNSSVDVKITVDKSECIIGTNAKICDSVVDFDEKISRLHCKVIRKEKNFYLSDLNSENGTYVNRLKLQPGEPMILRDGDVVSLAGSNFQVSIK